MSDISFNCPHCSKRLVVDQEGADLKMKCPVCEQPLRVPKESEPDSEGEAQISEEVIHAIAQKALRLRREAEPGEPVLIANDPEQDPSLDAPELDLAFLCPSCQNPLVVAYEGAGLDLQCPECTAGLDVPDPLHLPEDFPRGPLAAQILALQNSGDPGETLAQFQKTPQDVPLKPRRISRGPSRNIPAVTESGLTMNDELLEKAQNSPDPPAMRIGPISRKTGPQTAEGAPRKTAIKKPAGPLRFKTKGKTELTRKLDVAPASVDSPEARQRRERLLSKAGRSQNETLLPRKLAQASQSPQQQDSPPPDTQEPETGEIAAPENPTTTQKKSRGTKTRKPRRGALPTPHLPVVESASEKPFLPVGNHLQRQPSSRRRSTSRISPARIGKVLSPFLLAFLVLIIWATSVFLKTPEFHDRYQFIAPQQDSETDFQPVEISPIEEQTARATVEGFLNADSWQEALSYVRDPERVRPKMQEYYQDQPFQPEPVGDLSLNQSGWRMGHFLAAFTGLTEQSFQNRIFHLERLPGGQWKLDWETYVTYNPLDWEELKTQRPTDPVILRCSLTPGDYFNFSFSDRTQYVCFRLHDQTGQFTGIYGYAQSGTELADALISAFQNTSMPALMLEVQYPENAGQDNQVQITNIIRRGWIVL